MDSKSQAGLEYLFAIVLSFLLTLVVLAALVGFANSTKESMNCKLGHCDQNNLNPVQKIVISENVLFFTATLIAFYFVEFSFVVLFLKYLGKPEKKKLAKHSKY